jgi:hypothetical protein
MIGPRFVLIVAMLAGFAVACSTDDLSYDPTWAGADLPVVVRHGDGLVLVGIDPERGAAHVLAPIVGLVPQEGRLPEAASLVVTGRSLVVVTDGSDDGRLFQMDVPGRRLAELGKLAPARLPLAESKGLMTVGGSGSAFRRQLFGLDAQPEVSRSLEAVPYFSDGHCLAGIEGAGGAAKIVLLPSSDPFAEPRVLADGTPGGVWCDDAVGLVTLAGLPSTGRDITRGDELLVVRGDRVDPVKVAPGPGLVAGDGAGRFAVVVFQGTGEVKTIDLGTGAVVMSASLPNDLQPNAIAVRGDRIVVLGGSQGAIIPLHGGAVTGFPLPGDNVTSVLH